ncbi:MAG: hypothetical protein E7313_02355 [Clostridiales bacterium]|nr:hypothetical protein [Clostridiales bacterium]
MEKKNSKIQKIDIVLLLITLLLVVIILTLYLKKIIVPKQEEQKQYQLTTVVNNKEEKKQLITVPKNEEELIKELSILDERSRLEYYCGRYFECISNKQYENAYNMLYSEFKEKYFPTLEQYEEYIKKIYPSSYAVEYEDITRQGTIYVFKIKILDLEKGKQAEKAQRIVVQENNYNDFVISFQVI